MTKKELTLNLLRAAARRGQGVSNRQLNDAGVFRYSARIKELRDEGHEIETIGHKNGLYEFRLILFPSPLGSGEGAGVGDETTRPAGESSDGMAEPSGDTQPVLFACDLNDSPYY